MNQEGKVESDRGERDHIHVLLLDPSPASLGLGLVSITSLFFEVPSFKSWQLAGMNAPLVLCLLC